MKLIKKVAGIDISKDSFTVCFGILDESLNQKISKSFTFSNDRNGFKKLIKSLTSSMFSDQKTLMFLYGLCLKQQQFIMKIWLTS